MMLKLSKTRIAGIAALTMATLTSAGMAAAQERPHTVPSVGAMKDIAGAQEKPDPRATYKIVFDVQTLGDSSDEASPALQSIGGLINTYTGYGVPLSRMQMTAVFHGRTIQLVTRDDIYRQRTCTPTNSNAQILGELAAAGVHMVVCGQSALAQHFGPADYLPGVTTNLSATVTFLNLQTQGYVKITE